MMTTPEPGPPQPAGEPAPTGTPPPAAAPTPAARPGSLMQNIKEPMLVEIRDQIERQLPPELEADYRAILRAGMKLMFSKQTHGFMMDYVQHIQASPPEQVPTLVAHGVIKMLTIIWNESKGKMKIEAAFPAATTLMCYALEYVKSLGIHLPLNKEMLAQTTKQLAAGFFKAFHITQSQIRQAVKQGRPAPGQGPSEATPPAEPAPRGGGLMARAGEGGMREYPTTSA